MPIEVVIAIFGGGVAGVLLSQIGTIVGKFVDRKHAKEDKKDEHNDRITKLEGWMMVALRGLYYDKIKYLGHRYISEGCITLEEKRDLIELHRIYKDILNGDGFLDEIMADVRSLRVVSNKKRNCDTCTAAKNLTIVEDDENEQR